MNTREHLGGSNNSRGYLLVRQDWYEIEDEPDPLRRNAIISTLNPDAFRPTGNAQIVRRGYQVLEPMDAIPVTFTICECRPVGQTFETFEDACDFLQDRGVKEPQLGFNPIS